MWRAYRHSWRQLWSWWGWNPSRGWWGPLLSRFYVTHQIHSYNFFFNLWEVCYQPRNGPGRGRWDFRWKSPAFPRKESRRSSRLRWRCRLFWPHRLRGRLCRVPNERYRRRFIWAMQIRDYKGWAMTWHQTKSLPGVESLGSRLLEDILNNLFGICGSLLALGQLLWVDLDLNFNCIDGLDDGGGEKWSNGAVGELPGLDQDADHFKT